MHSEGSCGVLIVNTGTPEAPKPHAVRKYLAKFLMDKHIAPMNRAGWWIIVHLFILPKRGKASAAKYAKIWTNEGSPFTIAHEKLAAGLGRAFQEEGASVVVRHAMSYGEPSILQAVRELSDAGCTRLVVLPLYPQSAYSTVGPVSDAVACAVKRAHWKGEVTVAGDYHENPVYVKAVAASIKHAGFDPESNDRILFSFHSIPLADIEAGDTYELQTGASSLQIASELGLERTRWTIGYQCRFDMAREWLSPFTKDVLARWAEAGGGRVFVVCPNFAVDCLETLYDIDYELKPYYFEQLRHAGRQARPSDFTYVPCLDKSRAHVKVLMDVLRPYVNKE